MDIAILCALAVAAVIFVPILLDAITNERAAPYETAPWTLAVSLAAMLAWFFRRRDRAPSGFRPAPRAAARALKLSAEAREPERKPRTVFISYRRSDSTDVTGRIYDRLAQRFGDKHVFKDVDTIPLGVDFRKHLDELVGRCDSLIAVIGRDWLGAVGADGVRLDDPRDLVRIEIVSALARGIPVVPVLVGGAGIPDERELPEDMRDLAYRHGIPVRPDPDFHKDMDRLIAGLESHFRD
jgi:hypothetical protein